MSLHNQFYTANGQLAPQGLEIRGPVLQVEIQIPVALAAQLQSQGKTLPPPIVGLALVDTGASKTSVDDQAITQMAVGPINQITVQTPSGSALQYLYPARFAFPGTTLPSIDFGSVAGSVLAAQGIVALIGRDVLSKCILVYNGPAGMFSLGL
jgi:hypothetical protein